MTERYVRVVITTDIRVVDPTWDDQTLLENLPIYVGSAFHQAEKRNRERFPDEDQTYELCSDDVSVWLADDFVLDLAEIAALPPDQQATIATIANLPPAERSRVWIAIHNEGTPE